MSCHVMWQGGSCEAKRETPTEDCERDAVNTPRSSLPERKALRHVNCRPLDSEFFDHLDVRVLKGAPVHEYHRSVHELAHCVPHRHSKDVSRSVLASTVGIERNGDDENDASRRGETEDFREQLIVGIE